MILAYNISPNTENWGESKIGVSQKLGRVKNWGESKTGVFTSGLVSKQSAYT